MSIFITADLHLNHYHILELEKKNLASAGLSYIQSVSQYNEMIIRRINSQVRSGDTLYILGDFVFGGVENLTKFTPKIHGRKILIMGNHDTETYSITDAFEAGFSEVYNHPIYLPGTNGKVILSHFPAKEAYDNPYIVYNLHGHIHGGYLDLQGYKNVNISMTGYYPLNYDTIRSQVEHSGRNRNEKWLEEWYADKQIFQQCDTNSMVLDSSGHLLVEESKKICHKD
jgi:calcineurin-like phosphoesterase family protein